ncbi:4'-phosphopantetheinyl transferase superfamily protein [Amycolatopsis sp. NBC_00345]|uniref:4'-phosphopantetheinyl transferase family protein n=1 Tax=Amycolatopsis sp. NBC_00345 TaxID=2975955 RepID=UPI002E258568
MRAEADGPPADQVSVWRIPLVTSADVVRRLTGLLDPDELARRASILDPRAQERYAVAHGAIREILAGHLAVAPQRIRWTKSRSGKPELAALGGAPSISLSHSGDLALLAVAARPVGVDVERVRARWAVRPPTRLFPAAEAALIAAESPERRATLFVRLLTRKEACVKAAGATLLPRGIQLGVAGRSPLVASQRDDRWYVRDLGVGAGYGAAVAVTGTAGCTVSEQLWRLQDR